MPGSCRYCEPSSGGTATATVTSTTGVPGFVLPHQLPWTSPGTSPDGARWSRSSNRAPSRPNWHGSAPSSPAAMPAEADPYEGFDPRLEPPICGPPPSCGSRRQVEVQPRGHVIVVGDLALDHPVDVIAHVFRIRASR